MTEKVRLVRVGEPVYEVLLGEGFLGEVGIFLHPRRWWAAASWSADERMIPLDAPAFPTRRAATEWLVERWKERGQ